jgi:UDP-N-acetylmuramoyl-L-alanyl-D-glutamate--2,6-diaminopimelate ligase
MAQRHIGEMMSACAVSAPRLVNGSPDVIVSSMTHDSRQVRVGSLFCCIKGEKFDGHDFAAAAVERGAVALLVQREVAGISKDIPQIIVDEPRTCVGFAAAELYGNPSRHLSLVGITGTNGKTTTAHLLASIMKASGMQTEVIGTLSGTFTTPEASDLQRNFSEMVANGTRAVAMEVSSHALSLGRVNGTSFGACVFTNLGRDHLDFHGSEENYFLAKARLFAHEFTPVGVINADDVYGQRILRESPISMTPFSINDVEELQVSATSHQYVWSGRTIRVRIGGTVNVMNSLAAATAAREIGINTDDIVNGLESAPVVPGRFEQVEGGQDFVVLVDFAHTPDGLAEVLRSVRLSSPESRVILVFGCGGDRDKMKRPLMGEIAASLADVVIVTSDNPRSEDPEAIMSSIIAGIPDHMRHRLLSTDVDRRRAIQRAVSIARSGDVVLIAGKGHEVNQTIGAESYPFDDRMVALEMLRNIA